MDLTPNERGSGLPGRGAPVASRRGQEPAVWAANRVGSTLGSSRGDCRAPPPAKGERSSLGDESARTPMRGSINKSSVPLRRRNFQSRLAERVRRPREPSQVNGWSGRHSERATA